MNIYRYTSYQEAINRLVLYRKKKDRTVSFSDLAIKMKVEKAYVSRVMKGKAHFDRDQLFAASQYLTLSTDETEYLLLLLDHERSANPLRKKQLLGRINQIQTEQKHVKKHLDLKWIEPSQDLEYSAYYLDPYAPIVHMYLTLTRFRLNPPLIAPALGLSSVRLQSIMETLLRLQIIRNEKSGAVKVQVERMFLPGESPLSFPSEVLVRQMLLEHLQRLDPEQRLLYSFNFSADEATRTRLHEEFLKFLRTAESLIVSAPCEQVYRMNFDLFNWAVI